MTRCAMRSGATWAQEVTCRGFRWSSHCSTDSIRSKSLQQHLPCSIVNGARPSGSRLSPPLGTDPGRIRDGSETHEDSRVAKVAVTIAGAPIADAQNAVTAD